MRKVRRNRLLQPLPLLLMASLAFAAVSSPKDAVQEAVNVVLSDSKTPTADKKVNWLPAPNGAIYMVMRLYWPKTDPSSILPPGEGTWQPSAVVVAD